MKQTAVHFMVEHLTAIGQLHIPKGSNAVTLIIEQAKAMEKEQIMDAFNSGMNDSVDYFIPFLKPNDESENYYNETFKSE